MTDGKRFTIIYINIFCFIKNINSRIDFETLPVFNNVNVMDTMIGNKKVELVDKIIGNQDQKV